MSLDLDQKLFGFIWGLVSAARAKPRRGSAVDLADMEQKLALLAAAVAERRVELAPTVDRGGAFGDTLRLPQTLDTFDDGDANALLYVLRVVLDAYLMRLGTMSSRQGSDDVAAFTAVLLVPSLLHGLADEMPGVLRIVDELRPRILARLAAVSLPSERHIALHAALSFALVPKAPAKLPLTETDCARLRGVDAMDALGRALRVATRLAATRTRGDAFVDVSLPIVGPFPRAVASVEASLDAVPEAETSATERTAPPRDALRRVELGEGTDDENPLVHSFEKVHTAEAYQGGKKALDGEDELADHENALDEAALREVIRTSVSARSTYRMELLTALVASREEDVPAEDARAVRYDEWAGRAYRKGFCHLLEERAKDPPAGAPELRVSAERVRRIRKVFESLDDARRMRLRRASGSEVDIDAVVSRYAFVRAGKEGDHRLYAERRPVEQDVATMLLLDVSSSSDGYVDGRHVIGLEREAAACIGDALAELHAPFAVAGFYSHTHRDCRFLSVKRFREPWPTARRRLSAIEPRGYTRIGPAIRHATAQLAKVPARRRALLLVTDGRPTDYDQYEGRYGVDDVRMALCEAVRAGVTPFSICIARAKSSHLRDMFGATGYELVPSLDALADTLVAAERRFRIGAR